MHADQIVVDQALVVRLIEDHFPQFRGELIVGLDTSGTTNAIYRIGLDHVARFPLRAADTDDFDTLFAAEVEAIAEFNSYCPFASPKPIGVGRANADFPMPWTVQTWLDGSIATPGGQSTSNVFAHDLAHLILALRAVDVKGRVFAGSGRGGNLADHDAWIELCLTKSEGLLDVGRLRSMWASMRELPSLDYIVMSHNDLIPGNVLVSGDRVIGILDTGGFGPADPALDLVAGWHMLDRDARTSFRQALHVDELEWLRGGAWAFHQAIGLVWYYAETNRPMSELGRSTLGRLIEDYAL